MKVINSRSDHRSIFHPCAGFRRPGAAPTRRLASQWCMALVPCGPLDLYQTPDQLSPKQRHAPWQWPWAVASWVFQVTTSGIGARTPRYAGEPALLCGARGPREFEFASAIASGPGEVPPPPQACAGPPDVDTHQPRHCEYAAWAAAAVAAPAQRPRRSPPPLAIAQWGAAARGWPGPASACAPRPGPPPSAGDGKHAP